MVAKKVEIYNPDGDLVYPKTTAENVLLVDAGNKFTSTNLEGALQELGSTSSTGGYLCSQTAHSLTVLTPIFFNIDTSLWAPAKADSADTLATHVITSVVDVDSFIAGQIGTFTVTSHGLALGYWFTSPTTAGSLTQTDSGDFSNPVLFVQDVNTIFVLSYRPSAIISSSGNYIGTQYFTSSGTYVKGTNNPSFVIVEVGGGCGSGGHGGATNTCGGGGAGGGYSRKKIMFADLAASETVTVGVVVAGIITGGPGTIGNSSSFGSHCSATGGGPGLGNQSGGNIPSVGGDGIGGDYNLTGQPGFIFSLNYAFTGGGNSHLGGTGGFGYCGTSSSYASGDGSAGMILVHEYS